MKIRVGQYGARMYYGIPRALEGIGFLEKLYTDFTVNKGVPKHLSRIGRFSSLKNRHAVGLPSGKIVHMADLGLAHRLRVRNAKTEIEINRHNFEQGVRLEKKMMADGMKLIDGICMIGSPSEMIFDAARQKGITTIMEQIIAPASTYLSILDTFLKPYQNWEEIPASLDSVQYWQDVSDKEWRQSDFILSGSDFVSDGLRICGVKEKKIVTIPYGVPVMLDRPPAIKSFIADRKLRVLFVGTVGIRKGIQYLLEIARELNEFCEITICGSIALKKEIVDRFKDVVNFAGHVSRADIGSYYEWADVFVLPTLFEGSATVCYEAIQYALPIITTKNSGIFVKDGNGVTIIPEGDTQSLSRALRNYYNYPEQIEQNSKRQAEQIQFASMNGYQQRIQAFFKSLQKDQ